MPDLAFCKVVSGQRKVTNVIYLDLCKAFDMYISGLVLFNFFIKGICSSISSSVKYSGIKHTFRKFADQVV